MNPFTNMTMQLSTAKNDKKNITVDQYTLFQKEYLFDNLQGTAYGKAFCKRFDITDIVLNIIQDETFARTHITLSEYVKT